MANKPYNVGDIVLVTVNSGSYQIVNKEAKIVYMDYSAGLYRDEFFPIMVEFSEPWGESDQKVLRVNVRELKRLEQKENRETNPE